jgi:hypothetical protein
MENKEEFIKCSYYNCDKSFTKDYYSSGLKTPPINDEDKFYQILEGLMKTRLFCMKCSTNHATIICLNSKIQIEK